MKYILLLLTTLFFSIGSFSQSAEDSIKATINTLFAAMKNGNAYLFKTVFSDSAIMQTIIRNKEGHTQVKTESVNEFASFVSQLKKDSAATRMPSLNGTFTDFAYSFSSSLLSNTGITLVNPLLRRLAILLVYSFCL